VVFKRESVTERLKELDVVLALLRRYADKTPADLQADLALRWIVERGLLAGATLIFDVADHILAAHFTLYPQTYRESLERLRDRGVISPSLWEKMATFAGLRNILAHEYMTIDIPKVHRQFLRALETFPQFQREVQEWLDREGKGHGDK